MRNVPTMYVPSLFTFPVIGTYPPFPLGYESDPLATLNTWHSNYNYGTHRHWCYNMVEQVSFLSFLGQLTQRYGGSTCEIWRLNPSTLLPVIYIYIYTWSWTCWLWMIQTMENHKSHIGRTATKKCQQVLYGLHQEMLNLDDQVCEPCLFCFFLRCLAGFAEKVGIACWGEQPVRSQSRPQ